MKENGFLKFDNLRVGRDALLSKYVDINKNGELKIKGNVKMIYSSMMSVRKHLVSLSFFQLSKVVAILLRYSFIRKQFKNSKQVEN